MQIMNDKAEEINDTTIGPSDKSDRKRPSTDLDGESQERQPQRPKVPSKYSDCPIKLFATKQDISLRKKNKGEDKRKTHPAWTQCWTLREMIGVEKTQGNERDDSIDWLVISNYIVDFEFLLDELPELLSVPTTVVFYGSKDNSEEPWKAASSPTSEIDVCCLDPSKPPFTPSNPLKVQLNFGVHHTKFFLVGYSTGRLRVIVHTANSRYNDVHMKTQGAYIQDFWPKASPSSPNQTSEFEMTLISYIKTYHYSKQHTWSKFLGETKCTLVDVLCKYDFSTAMGVLIPSTPGFHKPIDFNNWGYLKLGQAISRNTISPFRRLEGVTNSKSTSLAWPRPIVCQYSSVGSLSKNYLYNLEAAWDISRAHANSNKKLSNTCNMCPNSSRAHNFQLVYPTRDEICNSVEGMMGGNSVPGRKNNVNKPFLRPLYHKWSSSPSQSSLTRRSHNDYDSSSDSEIETSNLLDARISDPLNKAKNVPHIKTYFQPTQDEKSMEWFVLSSHNLSKGKILPMKLP